MADVACPSCGETIQVADEAQEQECTCEKCGTKFVPASQPEGMDINATMSMGQAFHVPPVAQEPESGNRTVLIVLGVIAVVLIAMLLFM